LELENLIKLEEKLEKEHQRQRKRQAYPWYLLFFTCIIMAIVLQFGIIPGIEYTTVRNKDPSLLEDQLKKMIDDTKY